jgi:hypothetical protein
MGSPPSIVQEEEHEEEAEGVCQRSKLISHIFAIFCQIESAEKRHIPISSLVLSKWRREATIRNLLAADRKLSARVANENMVLSPVSIVVIDEMAPTIMLIVGLEAVEMIGEALKKEPNDATKVHKSVSSQ